MVSQKMTLEAIYNKVKVWFDFATHYLFNQHNKVTSALKNKNKKITNNNIYYLSKQQYSLFIKRKILIERKKTQ